MRLLLIAPSGLSGEQNRLYDAMRKGIASTVDEMIYLVGPVRDGVDDARRFQRTGAKT